MFLFRNLLLKLVKNQPKSFIGCNIILLLRKWSCEGAFSVWILCQSAFCYCIIISMLNIVWKCILCRIIKLCIKKKNKDKCVISVFCVLLFLKLFLLFHYLGNCFSTFRLLKIAVLLYYFCCHLDNETSSNVMIRLGGLFHEWKFATEMKLINLKK